MREIKKDFPIFASKEKNGESFVYLDSAATTHKPQDVLDALIKFYTTSYASVGRSIYSSSREASQEFSLVRQKIRDWLGAAFEEEIVFTRGTTAGLNTLAIAVNDLWSSGGVVLVSETEHHANVISWEIACRRRGSSVKKNFCFRLRAYRFKPFGRSIKGRGKSCEHPRDTQCLWGNTAYKGNCGSCASLSCVVGCGWGAKYGPSVCGCS